MPHEPTSDGTVIAVPATPIIRQEDCLICSNMPTAILLDDIAEALSAVDELVLVMSRLGIFKMIPFAIGLQDALRVSQAMLQRRDDESAKTT